MLPRPAPPSRLGTWLSALWLHLERLPNVRPKPATRRHHPPTRMAGLLQRRQRSRTRLHPQPAGAHSRPSQSQPGRPVAPRPACAPDRNGTYHQPTNCLGEKTMTTPTMPLDLAALAVEIMTSQPAELATPAEPAATLASLTGEHQALIARCHELMHAYVAAKTAAEVA